MRTHAPDCHAGASLTIFPASFYWTGRSFTFIPFFQRTTDLTFGENDPSQRRQNFPISPPFLIIAHFLRPD